MKEQITYNDFEKIDIRLGTVIDVEKNEKARKPYLVLKVDFGDKIGIKQSSAQITHFYNKDNLVGKASSVLLSFDSLKGSWWKIWTWFTALRKDRFFKSLLPNDGSK